MQLGQVISSPAEQESTHHVLWQLGHCTSAVT
jgi:hypothetical protein